MTWEVRREIPTGWITVYECSGTDFSLCYLSALRVMSQWKQIYPEYEWELMGY